MRLFLFLLVACNPETNVNGNSDGSGDTGPEIVDPTTNDEDHDGAVDADDCAPLDNTIYPGALELCDEVDNDCDGQVDGVFDADDDGYDDVRDCWKLDGVWDCDDDRAEVNPGAEEVCDGLDNDCNDEVDEVDEDDDTFTACIDDCDDDNPFVFDGAAEACDGLDNDCNGRVDELWDGDGDGYSPCNGDCEDDDPEIGPDAGDPCDGIDNDCDDRIDEDFDLDADGQATCAGDCDDSNAAVYVGAEEICDGYDNDCLASTDESNDADGDGVSICGGDCDDTSPAALPGGSETCDDVDNDCNGYVDELESCWSCTSSSGYLLCTTGASWDTAAQVCEGLGGWLVEINDSSENTTVANMAVTPTWIGASDAAVEGDWVWTDGSSIHYDNWGSGEPDDSGDSDCAQTNTSGRRGEWSDQRCTTEYKFVCEF